MFSNVSLLLHAYVHYTHIHTCVHTYIHTNIHTLGITRLGQLIFNNSSLCVTGVNSIPFERYCHVAVTFDGMCLCMYICMCVCMYVCMYVCIYVCMY